MEILKGLLTINGADAYERYGVFLSEEKEGGMDNYNELMRPAASKGYICVDFREQDGEKYPDELVPAFAARDLDLRFTLEAENKEDFLAKYRAFITALKTGDKGWLTLTLTDIGKSYRVFYKDCPGWSQLTGFEGKVYSSFKVQFREPVPEY